MKKRLKVIAAYTALTFALFGCNGGTNPGAPLPEQSDLAGTSQETSIRSPAPIPSEPDSEAAIEMESKAETGQSYIDQAVRETAAKFVEPGMSEYERAKAAFDYMIETTNLTEPVGLDLWRIRGNGDEQPSYVESRSLSVLLYGIGMCEDYAAAFTMLLRGAGLEAEYVPGLTYSTEGALVDHAWAVAKIDGVWYHLDCQLEDNISRHGAIRYRYFMKSDATMAASHRWGQNLIDSRLLTAEQNEEIARDYIPPACPQDYPTPSRHTFTAVSMPDVEAIKAEIDAEFREYELVHGPLEPLELNIIPPVFALDGYGPPD